MSNFTYIQFEAPKSGVAQKKPSKLKSWVENLVVKTVSTFIPKANPDFDNLIDKVTYWIVELNKDGIPEREIGLSTESKPLMVMPCNNNYGYWTDNNLKLKDFNNSFETTELDYESFKLKWYEFGEHGCSSCFKSKISEFTDERTWLEFDLELTKKLGKDQMKQIKSVHDRIPDKDGEFTIYQCSNCGTKWKLKEPYDRGGGYFKLA